MKMPATTNTKVEAKPSTDLGDAAKQCLNCLEKKVRNLEKRKGKIEINREKAEKGTKLEKEQEISLNQYEQVTHDLEFARELHKQFQTIHSEHEKMVKKQAKREKAERQAMEIKRVSEILQLQSTLDLMGGDKVREDFKTGKHGAVVLTDDNLEQLDQLYQAISPSRDDSGDDYPQKLTTAAEHLVNVLDGKDRQVLGTTYKELKELLTLINECGYFETAKLTGSEEGEAPESEAATEAVEEAAEDQDAVADNLSQDAASEEPEDETSNNSAQPVAQQQQPIDLTTSAPTATDGVKSHLDMPAQPMNTLEQDAFFAPSSTAYQNEAGSHFSQQQNPSQVPDFQSFTNNRPFQFIQASYIMSEQQTAPSVVDPAVIHAQPAGTGSNLQFMSAAAYDNTPPTQNNAPSQQPNQSQPNSSSNATVTGNQQAGPPQATPQDFVATQTFGQSALQQNLQAEGLFPVGQSSVVEEPPLAAHSGLMGQMREDSSSSSPYEIPPSIPMPPSQAQDQSQLDHQQHHQQHQQQLEEKKFQMNASAPVFQSMYPQQVATGAVPVSVPPPTLGSDTQMPPSAGGDFNAQNANPDFQQGYQGGNDFNYSRSAGGRGNYRGSRNGGPPSGARNGTGGGSGMQNGFGRTGGPSTNNGRGGRGGFSYGSNPYRQDNYQNAYNPSGFGGYQKRAGMNNPGGPPNVGNAGYNGRGGMRGGMPRGGQRGGNMRGGFSRPPPSQ